MEVHKKEVLEVHTNSSFGKANTVTQKCPSTCLHSVELLFLDETLSLIHVASYNLCVFLSLYLLHMLIK